MTQTTDLKKFDSSLSFRSASPPAQQQQIMDSFEENFFCEFKKSSKYQDGINFGTQFAYKNLA